MRQYSFERLEAWKDARSFVKWIYEVTQSFPADEKYGLTNQLRRAAVSVVSNIAEGSARTTPNDQAHFYTISYSSLIEILNQLILSNDLRFLSDEMLRDGRLKVEELTGKISALKNACFKRQGRPSGQ